MAFGSRFTDTLRRWVQPQALPEGAAVDDEAAPSADADATGRIKTSLIAHVAGIGDVTAGPDGWIGRNDMRQIEGFVFSCEGCDWNRHITYQVYRRDKTMGPVVAGGEYCGSRGLQSPILGFILHIPADQPHLNRICYEGIFDDQFRSEKLRPGTLCISPNGGLLQAIRITVTSGYDPAPVPKPKTESGPTAFGALFGMPAALPVRSPEPVARTQVSLGETPPPARPRADQEPQAKPAVTPPGRGDPDPCLKALALRHNGVPFLTPTDLTISQTLPRRVALVGSCFLEAWNIHGRNKSVCGFDLFTVNYAASLPDKPNAELQVSDYDFQIVQLSMRSFFHDDMLSKLPYADVAAHHAALEEAAARLAFQLQCSMKWNIEHGLLSFVANFPLPQKNIFGSLFPRFDIRNPEHFVYLLNEKLEEIVRSYKNAYVLDVDRICASFGRRYIQDDIYSVTSHNSILGTPDVDWSRIEPIAGLAAHYEIEWGRFLGDAVWAEALCMYRVVRQADSVKIVMLDLDDTLWRGVSGETEAVGQHMLNGWPEGLVEALIYLKKRGVLLAIVSKNDEQRIREIWPKIFGKSLPLDDFSAIRINWRPKAENVREILAAVNLLPRSAVFIDDNPAERAAVKAAFPEIRVLGRHPYYLRRILLWSSEMQGASITEESGRRTEMVQAQIVREDARSAMSRQDFLAKAAPKVTIGNLTSGTQAQFARAFELINKTNQFNTTGRRWTQEEMSRFFAEGGRLLVFEVTDAFTAYGLVGVILLRGALIEQWVMSCRVLGLDIEQAVMAEIVRELRSSGASEIKGKFAVTDLNFPCRDLFEKCGFEARGQDWVLPVATMPPSPAHVTITSLASAKT